MLGLSLLMAVSFLLTPASADAAKPGPDHHRPVVGTCYDYGVRGYLAEHGPQSKVDCAETHRALIVAAPRVQGEIDASDPAIFDKIGPRCYRALYKTLGGTQEAMALTAYDLGYYVPTQAELDKGAQWTRCDMLLLGGSRLAYLPDPLLPAVPSDEVARCLDKDLVVTTCSRPHRHRATGVVLVKGDDYPGPIRLDRIGERRCDTRTTSANYLWRYPGPSSWAAGKHLVTCFTKTRD